VPSVQCPAVKTTVGDSRLALHRQAGPSSVSNTASPTYAWRPFMIALAGAAIITASAAATSATSSRLQGLDLLRSWPRLRCRNDRRAGA
jgi:hypothetical protein